MDDLFDLDLNMDMDSLSPLAGPELDLFVDSESLSSLSSSNKKRAIESTSESSEVAPQTEPTEKVEKKTTLKKKKKTAAKAEDEEEQFGEMENSNIRFVPEQRPGNAFAFSKKELAVMTPADLDAYADEVANHHSLSAEEKELLKKYRRQVRNRASAQNSRARKRQHAESLEEEVNRLKGSNAELQNENQKLRDRVVYLEGVLDSRNVPYNKTRISLGVAVFALVFSFGLFFPLNSSVQMNTVASEQQTRHLMHTFPNEAPVVSLQHQALPPQNDVNLDSKSKNNRIRIVEPDTLAVVSAGHVIESPFVRVHEKQVYPQWDRPDTDYLYCPTAHHVLSNKHMDDEHRPPQRLSLLLPTDVFNGTMEMFRAGGAPMVEVTCSVLDIFPVFFDSEQKNHLIEASSK